MWQRHLCLPHAAMNKGGGINTGASLFFAVSKTPPPPLILIHCQIFYLAPSIFFFLGLLFCERYTYNCWSPLHRREFPSPDHYKMQLLSSTNYCTCCILYCIKVRRHAWSTFHLIFKFLPNSMQHFSKLDHVAKWVYKKLCRIRRKAEVPNICDHAWSDWFLDDWTTRTSSYSSLKGTISHKMYINFFEDQWKYARPWCT